MASLHIKSFGPIVDSTEIELTPLIVLIGRQSAGKNRNTSFLCIEREPEQNLYPESQKLVVMSLVRSLNKALKNTIFKHPSNDDIRDRIVAQSFPSNKSNPTMEKAKQKFRKTYNCELRGM